MIKDIIAKLGSKKVAGAILVMATLLVGIGVISNFSDDQKIANDAALSRFNDNAFNNFGSSTSRSALERQMSAQQDKNTTRFLQGKNTQDGMDEDDAFSSDGAYAEGVNGDEGFVYGDGGTYDPSNPRYVAGAYDEDGNLIRDGFGASGGSMSNRDSQGGSYGVGVGGSDDSGDEAGANDAKGAKGKNKGKGKNKVKNAKQTQTQLNKLAASSGSSTYGSSSGGGGASSGGSANINTGAFGDTNTRALPQNNTQITENDINVKAFRHGRGGNMGGMNVARSNGSVSDTGKGTRGSGAASDLQIATAYSGKALASNVDARAKMLAQAAFDGSNPEEIGTTIGEGATIASVANELMGGSTSNNLPPALKSGFQDLETELSDYEKKLKEIDRLTKDLHKMYIALYTTSLLASLGVFFLAKSAYGYGWAVAAAAANMLLISTFLWVGKNSINGLITQISNLADETGSKCHIAEKLAMFWTTFGVLTAVNAAALLAGFAKAVSGAKSQLKNSIPKRLWRFLRGVLRRIPLIGSLI